MKHNRWHTSTKYIFKYFKVICSLSWLYWPWYFVWYLTALHIFMQFKMWSNTNGLEDMFSCILAIALHNQFNHALYFSSTICTFRIAWNSTNTTVFYFHCPMFYMHPFFNFLSNCMECPSQWRYSESYTSIFASITITVIVILISPQIKCTLNSSYLRDFKHFPYHLVISCYMHDYYLTGPFLLTLIPHFMSRTLRI